MVGHRTGRPAKADQAYCQELGRLLGVDPRTLGLPFTIWTINRLRLYLAEQTSIFAQLYPLSRVVEP